MSFTSFFIVSLTSSLIMTLSFGSIVAISRELMASEGDLPGGRSCSIDIGRLYSMACQTDESDQLHQLIGRTLNRAVLPILGLKDLVGPWTVGREQIRHYSRRTIGMPDLQGKTMGGSECGHG
ncbi:unnamed protein product [Nesidiocoris tenuis]|uniref:Uncharacterized protein n=1 Tax=Nesidiocoris tenuis TaxID=355587 RepID=A0A6H5GCM1_9HEMI|nr:unnamed protein product [Nesidiocoris tenuis]